MKNPKFGTLSFEGQKLFWYMTHLLIVVSNHAKSHPSTVIVYKVLERTRLCFGRTDGRTDGQSDYYRASAT